MKNIKILTLFILFIITVPINAIAQESFIIDHFQVDIDVMENNAYKITETIDVNFTEQRHGIYRNIPSKFNGRLVKISNISVPNYKGWIETDRNQTIIKIGSSDSYVKGKKRYVISYTYDVGTDQLSDMDEFNHNLIGNQWDTTISAVDFNIHMPKNFNPEDVNFTSGPLGSTDNSNIKWAVNGTTITGHTLSPLHNYDGLTAALPLPEGYWVGTKIHREPNWLLFLLLGYPLYLLLILIAAVFWYFKGRDNKLFPTVEFSPPEGMTPAEIGYIIDGKVDDKDITSLIIYWADKGFLKIKEKPEDNSLDITKLKDLDNSAKRYEVRLFDKLFSYGDGVVVSTNDLIYKFHLDINHAQAEVKGSFTYNPDNRIYVQDTTYNILTGILSCLPILAILFQSFYVLTDGVAIPLLDEFVIPLILTITLGFFVFGPIFLLGLALVNYYNPEKIKVNPAYYLMILFFGVPTFIMSGLICSEADIPTYQFFIAVLSSLIISIFTLIMSRRTQYGDKMLSQTLGFKAFINAAEKDKLETMFNSNPTYFYNILPYAMVLNLSEKWSSYFNNIAIIPPSWYSGERHQSTFNTTTFNHTLNRSFKTMHSAMTTPLPSSSSSGSSGSSSSGGSSGGGSGGGGGGSW